MKLMEDAFLTHSIEIRTTPEKIFEFLSNLVDDKSYRTWHSDDHVALRWLKGSPWQEGSVIYAEEYIEQIVPPDIFPLRSKMQVNSIVRHKDNKNNVIFKI